MGRNKIENPKTREVKIRLNNDELINLINYALKNNLNKSQVIRKALNALYENENK